MNPSHSLETWLESLVGLMEDGEHWPAIEMTDGRLTTASGTTLDPARAQQWARGKANELGYTNTVQGAYVAVCQGEEVHLYQAATLDASGLWLDEPDCYRRPVRLQPVAYDPVPPLRLSPLAERVRCEA